MSQPEITGASIVLLGSFNPAIFHPAWFQSHELIRTQEAESAQLDITHPEVSSFSTDWFKVSVFVKRFVAETADAHHFEPLRDLVLGIFKLLEHTPASKMGLNRDMHFRIPSRERWHGFGHLVAPKKPWQKIMSEPGLISLVMQDTRKDPPGFIRVKVEPSTKVEHGVYIQINNHYEAKEKEGLLNFMEILKKSWAEVLENSEKIAEQLLSQEF
jgi:hypothetical protein